MSHHPRNPPARGGRLRLRASVTAGGRRIAAPLLLAAMLGGLLALPSAASPSADHPRSVAGGALSNLRLVDYFPSKRGWASMWREWSAPQTSTDFARIAALHGNCVRVIVSVPAFGWPVPSDLMIRRLSQTIALAKARGLRVELTLFDGWKGIPPIDASKTWVGKLLGSLQGNRQIAYIDLRNELPADTDPTAVAWARAMVPFVRGIDGGVPVTVSTSISSGIAPLSALVRALAASPPNLYDVHYYGNAADAYATLAQAKQVAGAVPLFVGETGFATDPAYGWAQGLQPDAPSLESYQDYYFRMVEYATRRLALPVAAPWILYDMPGQGGTQWGYHMGILHADGTPKPAAGTLSRVFSGKSLGTSFNGGFEQSAGRPPLPTLWREWMAHDAEFSIDHRVAHSGKASVRIAHSRGDQTTGCPAYSVAPIAAVVPGITYSAGAWARGRMAAGQSRVVLVWSDAQGRFVSSTSSPSLPPGSSRWRLLTASGKPPIGASAVEINLQVCENPGTTWFDDVSFSSVR
jgi:hypothetical protein